LKEIRKKKGLDSGDSGDLGLVATGVIGVLGGALAVASIAQGNVPVLYCIVLYRIVLYIYIHTQIRATPDT
jgi:hypothetical protein